jgi:MFS family permease
MNEQRPLRARDWLLLASLYTTQFLPVAFFFMALPAILREAGMSLDDLTALYALGFVWVFKVLWAPLVDGFGWGRLGHHRGWLLVMQAAMIAILLVIGQIDGINQFSTVLLLSFTLTVFAATQDIATDAIACRLLGPRQRGIGNGIQVGGGLVGMILGGGATLFLYAQIGWSGIFYLLASALLVTFCQVVAFEEPAAPDMPPARPGLLRIASFWRQTGAAWAVLLALAPMGMGMMFGLMTPMMIDAGKTPEWIGLMQNTVAPLAAIAAVLATGAAISRFGAVRMLITAALVQALIILAFLAVAKGVAQDPLPALLVVVAAIVYNPTVTILTTMMMARVGIGSEGTDFYGAIQPLQLGRVPCGRHRLATCRNAGLRQRDRYCFRTFRVCCMSCLLAFQQEAESRSRCRCGVGTATTGRRRELERRGGRLGHRASRFVNRAGPRQCAS